MATNRTSKKIVNRSTGVVTGKKTVVTTQSASAIIADRGITDSSMFANLMSALVGDVLNARVSTDVANAAVNAGGKLLKVVELRYRYGNTKPNQPRPKALLLTA